jgi:hypothetical protein
MGPNMVVDGLKCSIVDGQTYSTAELKVLCTGDLSKALFMSLLISKLFWALWVRQGSGTL